MTPIYSVAEANPADTWAQMISSQQGVDPMAAELAELSNLALLKEQAQKQKPLPWNNTRLSITQKFQAPQAPEDAATEREMLNLVKEYGLANQQALTQQEQGVGTLAQKIQALRDEGPSANWKPLAAFLDTMTGGNLAASVPVVETPQQYQQRMLGLEGELQQARGGLSKEKASALRDQIAAFKAAKDTTLQDELTRAKTSAYRAAAGEKAGGKILPETAVSKISDFDNSLNELSNIAGNIEANKKLFGPIAGRVNAANPYNEGAQSLQADLNRAKQVIGKAVEGGVLRKEDEEKYVKMLPTLADTSEVAAHKWGQFVKKLVESRNVYVKNLSGAGYKTSGLPSTKTPQMGLQPGHVEDGFKFKGGNPGDPKNWEKTQ